MRPGDGVEVSEGVFFVCGSHATRKGTSGVNQRMFHKARGRSVEGFTLLETIAALLVISIATTMLVSFFTMTVMLGRGARHERVAASLAEERLLDLLQNPDKYVWPTAEVLDGGGTAPIAPVGEQTTADRHPCEMPSVTPVDAAPVRHFYQEFWWQAFATRPEGGAFPYVEVTVVVGWVEAERTRTFTLTATAPMTDLEAAA